MFPRLTPLFQLPDFSTLTSRLPSQCAVCKSWPTAQVCKHCVSRFLTTPARCRLCAICLPPDLSAGLSIDLSTDLAAGRDVCIDCIKHPPPLDNTWVAVDYAYPWSELITQYKFANKPGWSQFFAQLLLQAPAVKRAFDSLGPTDLIVPIPLAKERLQTRGFNQAWELAKQLARLSGCRATPQYDVLLRVKNTQPQTALNRQARLDNLKGAFQIDPLRAAALGSRRVVLVDDVMTSGASLFTAAEVLRAAGVLHIGAIALARTPQ